jgi:hypothetical protein
MAEPIRDGNRRDTGVPCVEGPDMGSAPRPAAARIAAPRNRSRGSALTPFVTPANSEIEIRIKKLRGAAMMDRHPYAFTLAAAAVCAMLLNSSGASARTADFDGNWSVLVITESGTCDAAYRYGVSVENGTVRYRGESGIDVRGTVDDSGHVSVTIGRGDQRAEGTGRLTVDSGTGTWSGSSTTSNCRGRWEAERR